LIKIRCSAVFWRKYFVGTAVASGSRFVYNRRKQGRIASWEYQQEKWMAAQIKASAAGTAAHEIEN
jgi:hypothetical protein